MDSHLSQEQHIRKLFAAGRKIYDKTPACYRWILSPLRSIHTLSNVFRPKVWIITGHEVLSRKKLAILYAGHEVNKNYLVKLAFNSSYKDLYIGRKWLWEIRGLAKEKEYDCSLIIAEVPNSLRVFSGKTKSFFVPSWVSGEIDASFEEHAIFNNRNNTLMSDLRRIRRNSLYYEVTDELSQLRNFYYNMYLPYTTKVHGSRSIIPSYNYVKSEFIGRRSSNTLLLVKKKEEYIAGVLLLCRKNKTKLWIGGLKDGNLDYVKEGAIGALFYFSFKYLKQKGFTRINFGGSRPFLKDGVLQYKKKWNQKLFNRKELGFFLKMLSETDSVKGFLFNNPFIFQDKTGLNGAVFIDTDKSISTRDCKKIYKDYYLNGLSRLVIYRFGKYDNTRLGIVPQEYSEKIIMCSAETIFGQC
ncbi:MAG: hypothetical protein ACYS3S_05150 [Planctomycetota bacterium]|jgi:hypothetical protein